MALTSWHDLLSEKKLIAHLAADNPDPSPTELIAKLMAHAPATPSSEDSGGSPDVELLDQPLCIDEEVAGGEAAAVVDQQLVDRKAALWQGLQQSARAARRVACRQYKLLAIKVAAHLNWDFRLLDYQVPLPIQQALFTHLLTECCYSDDDGGAAMADVSIHYQQLHQLQRLSPQAMFAVSLYHRWVLWNCCQSAMPRRPVRTLNIPMPGQLDAGTVPPQLVDSTRQLLESQAPLSLQLLGRLLRDGCPAMVLPSGTSFGNYTVAGDGVMWPRRDWSSCPRVPPAQISCQLNFELGRYHFYRGEYGQAGGCFGECRRFLQELQSTNSSTPASTSSGFVRFPESELVGYCQAVCAFDGGLSSSSVPSEDRSLEHRLRTCMTSSDGGGGCLEAVVDILREDNVLCQISLVSRDILAVELHDRCAQRPDSLPAELPAKVDVLNCVRKAVEGHHLIVDVAPYICDSPQLASFLLDTVDECLSRPTTSEDETRRLSDFVSRVCHHAAPLSVLMTSHPAAGQLFSPAELSQLAAVHQEAVEEIDEAPDDFRLEDNTVEVGRLERMLIETYEADGVRAALTQLATLQPGRQLWRVYCGWELPIPLQGVISGLSAGPLHDFFYILMAKARHLLLLKRFERSRSLLEALLTETETGAARLSPTAGKLSRLIGWEKLLADLLQLLHSWPKLGDYRDLTRRARGCLAALHAPAGSSAVVPRSELVEHCTIHLLNVCEWDHLSEAERRWPQLDLAALLASVCRELVNKGNSRKMSRDLWNAVIPMFSSTAQQKRSAAGNLTSSRQRDSPLAIMGRTQLTQFIEKICEHTSLSLLISLLVRLHNLLRDDSTREMSMEHAMLWPNVVSSASSFSLKTVTECLRALLSQAIRLYPSHVPWLQAMADLCFAEDEHSTSLRYYLEACLVSSEYFVRPVPRTVLSEAVLRRMIRCCAALHCYTQAAVLCQFLDETDYATAFQLVSERHCTDAMDAYYPCVWDVSLLEFLTHLHHRRSELDKRQLVVKLLGQLELNANNNQEIQREAAAVRKARFLRAMVKHYTS